MKSFAIDNKTIGPDQPVYIIAEIGSNHAHDKTVVRRLIDLAADFGFDAVKFQTYEPLEVFSGAITTRSVHFEKMFGDRPWVDVARDQILMPRDWFGEMFAYARERGLSVFSTVHSARDAEFVMQFDPPVFKVASIDVSYTQFLAELARFGRPIILSTGMHLLGEIETAVETIRRAGNDAIALLHCVSVYPPRPETVNLRNIATLQQAFNVPVGFSDHSTENRMTGAAVALGACIVEKHITLDRAMVGADHGFALDPAGMRDLVVTVREVEAALGASARCLSEDELAARQMVRRSIVARRAIAAGEPFSLENLKLTRPGSGIHPSHLPCLLGRRARQPIMAEDVIAWDMVD